MRAPTCGPVAHGAGQLSFGLTRTGFMTCLVFFTAS